MRVTGEKTVNFQPNFKTRLESVSTPCWYIYSKIKCTSMLIH